MNSSPKNVKKREQMARSQGKTLPTPTQISRRKTTYEGKIGRVGQFLQGSEKSHSVLAGDGFLEPRQRIK